MKNSMNLNKRQKNILGKLIDVNSNEQVKIFVKLIDIACINKLENTNLIDSVKMIKQKGLENLLVQEVEMSSDAIIEVLESNSEFNDTCQTVYEYEIDEWKKETQRIKQTMMWVSDK